MKSIFVSLFGVFTITAIITHIWTVIIAFTEAGFFWWNTYVITTVPWGIILDV
jgi:hypothetical protein